MKRPALGAALGLAALLLLPAAGRAVAGLSPGAAVLIIGGDNDLSTAVNIQTALNALVPPPSQVDICYARRSAPYDVGIQPALTRCGIASLNNYCQIWDVRMYGSGSGTVEYDTLTLGGAGTDQQLYETHLSRGGSLFLLGENETLVSRNQNLIQFLNNLSTGGLIPYPSQLSTNIDFTTFLADPLSFATTPNALTRRHTKWPGAVPLGSTGSGRPFNVINYTSDGGVTTDWVHAFGFLSQDLSLGSGRIFVELDWTSVTNAGDYTSYAVPSLAANQASIQAWFQNAYTWLGNCPERFVFSKAASVAPPASVCLGDTFSYYLCVQNVGVGTVAAKTMWDTIPSCMSYVGASPAPASVTGNYVLWNLPSVAPGTTSCVTLTVRADSASCP